MISLFHCMLWLPILNEIMSILQVGCEAVYKLSIWYDVLGSSAAVLCSLANKHVWRAKQFHGHLCCPSNCVSTTYDAYKFGCHVSMLTNIYICAACLLDSAVSYSLSVLWWKSERVVRWLLRWSSLLLSILISPNSHFHLCFSLQVRKQVFPLGNGIYVQHGHTGTYAKR